MNSFTSHKRLLLVAIAIKNQLQFSAFRSIAIMNGSCAYRWQLELMTLMAIMKERLRAQL